MNARDAIESLGRPDILLVDLRENSERAKHGMLSGALHAPYPGIGESLQPGGMLREVAAATGRRIVFFCAFGERSAMAVTAAKEARARQHRPYRGRHRRLEEGRRAGAARLRLHSEMRQARPEYVAADRSAQPLAAADACAISHHDGAR